MEVIQSDVHPVDAVHRQGLRQRLHGLLRLQQRHGLRPVAHHFHKLSQIVCRAPHGQHNDVRTVGNGCVDFGL